MERENERQAQLTSKPRMPWWERQGKKSEGEADREIQNGKKRFLNGELKSAVQTLKRPRGRMAECVRQWARNLISLTASRRFHR